MASLSHSQIAAVASDNCLQLLLLGGVAILTAILFFHLRDPLRSVPGPMLARWSRLWMVYHSQKGDMHRTMLDLHKKYGPLVRTAPNELSTIDLDATKAIYAVGTKFRKSDWYSVWQGRRKFDLFPERNERVHSANRRLVSSIYSMSSLKELESYIDRTLTVFTSRLAGIDTTCIDMSYWVQLFAFDVIGEVTFSKRFGFIDKGTDDGAFSQIDDASKSGSWVGQIPWVYWLNDFLSPYIGNRLGISNRHGSIREFAAGEVDKRKARGSDRRDILERLMEIHKQKPAEMDDTAVLSMATSNVFAGSDTTAISISAVLYNLCKYPVCKEKLTAEIVDEIRKGKVGRSVPLDIALKMPYLQACIYEALRLHPAIGMSLPRVVPEGGMTIRGVHIPTDTVIGTNPWVIHRSEQIFGEDVDAFRPERWLNGNQSQFERYFFAFGQGSRVCFGKNLSWIEISKLIPSLLLNFDLKLADPNRTITETCGSSR